MHWQNLKLLLLRVYEEMHLQENTLFDLDLGVNVTQNVTQYPIHHVIYASTKFEVATFNGLGEDTITRNVTNGRMADRPWYEINIPYFSNEKASINSCRVYYFRTKVGPSSFCLGVRNVSCKCISF